MRLSFKTKFPWGAVTNFVNKIKRHPDYRPKITTIREDPNDRWKPGRKIDFTTGSRYKPVVFHSDTCKSTQKLSIIYEDSRQVFVENKKLSPREVEVLALNDGFDSVDDFFKWFDKTQIGLKLIHWTDLKY